MRKFLNSKWFTAGSLIFIIGGGLFLTTQAFLLGHPIAGGFLGLFFYLCAFTVSIKKIEYRLDWMNRLDARYENWRKRFILREKSQ